MTSATSTNVKEQTRQKPVATDITYTDGTREIISLDPMEFKPRNERVPATSVPICRAEVETIAGDESLKDGNGLKLRLSAVKALGQESLQFLKELNAISPSEPIRRATLDRVDILSARRGRDERSGQVIRT